MSFCLIPAYMCDSGRSSPDPGPRARHRGGAPGVRLSRLARGHRHGSVPRRLPKAARRRPPEAGSEGVKANASPETSSSPEQKDARPRPRRQPPLALGARSCAASGASSSGAHADPTGVRASANDATRSSSSTAFAFPRTDARDGISEPACSEVAAGGAAASAGAGGAKETRSTAKRLPPQRQHGHQARARGLREHGHGCRASQAHVVVAVHAPVARARRGARTR